MSQLEEIIAYLDEVAGREVTALDLVRTAAERRWGPIGAILLLTRHFHMSLVEAKGLAHELCSEHGLLEVYEAACKAADPGYPHGR